MPSSDRKPQARSLPWDEVVLFTPPRQGRYDITGSWVQYLQDNLASRGFATTAKCINQSSGRWVFRCEFLAAELNHQYRDPNSGPEVLRRDLRAMSHDILAAFEYETRRCENDTDPPPYILAPHEPPCTRGSVSHAALFGGAEPVPDGMRRLTVIPTRHHKQVHFDPRQSTLRPTERAIRGGSQDRFYGFRFRSKSGRRLRFGVFINDSVM